MDSRNEHHWSISLIGDPITHRGGSVATRPQAWLAALAVGRTALLSGQLAIPAASGDGQLEALLDPGPNVGVPDAAAVMAELLQMYQSATADGQLERLIIGARPLPF